MRPPTRLPSRLGVLAVAAAVITAALAVPAHADPPPHIVDDQTQPVYDYADAVYHEVDIQTGVDSDGDGEPDTVRMRVMRPRETEDDLQVPTILLPSPYWAGGHDLEMHPVDLDDTGAGTVPPRPGGAPAADDPHLAGAAADPTADPAARTISGYYDNFFLPRGYAVAELDSLGTGGSTGCPTSGGHNETLGVTAAVDWLNGRTTATEAGGDAAVAADWSTGSVGMSGISYNGTLPIAAATAGVEGLETIVPQGAISSWYDYYRQNGGVVAPGGYQGEDADVLAAYVYTRDDDQICQPVLDDVTTGQDRDTGDYNAFWAERNYRDSIGDITASVFVAHGLNDWNVKTDQALRLWTELGEHGVDRKLWLYQPGHINPFNLRMEEWLDQLHRWFDHWLYDLDTGITAEPAVDVQNADLAWTTHDDWPVAPDTPVRLHLNAAPDAETGELAGRPGRGPGAVETFTDVGRTVTADELATDPEHAGEHALVYLSDELSEDVRLSGVPEVSLRAAMDGASPYLTALLVDYGTDTRPTAEVVRAGTEPVCYGAGVPEDTGCAFRSQPVTETSDYKIVSRGSLDARNRQSLESQLPVVSGRTYTYGWPMQAQDYVFPEGHRIGVVLISTDYDYTLRYPAGTEVAVNTYGATVTLPVTQGRGAIK